MCVWIMVYFSLAEAKTLCAEGKPELGVRKLTKAIVLNPTDPELFRLRAEACVSAQDYHTAIINFKKVNKSYSIRSSALLLPLLHL